MLCRTIGPGRWMHPEQMLAEMPRRWFEDWQTVYEENPWGDEREDMRMARIAWAIRGGKESDYDFRFGPPPPPPTPDEYRRKSMRAYAMSGGAISNV